jgi:hypothetical protein
MIAITMYAKNRFAIGFNEYNTLTPITTNNWLNKTKKLVNMKLIQSGKFF